MQTSISGPALEFALRKFGMREMISDEKEHLWLQSYSVI